VVEEGMTTEEDRQRLKQQIRDEFLQSAVTAGEVTKVSDNDDDSITTTNGKYNRKMLLIGGVIAVIVIIGVVVGIVFGTNKETTTVVVENASSPTLSPQPSTLSPTSTTQPSAMPSTVPSVQPSAVPSVSIANLDNRNFTEAHPLALGNAPFEDFLSNAAIQTVSVDCGALSISIVPGLWYTYRAKSSGPVNVIACAAADGVSSANDVVLDVYTYIGNFACVLTSYTNGNIGNCAGGSSSSVSWQAEIGEQYYILLRIPLSDDNDIANTTTVQEEDDNFTIQIVDNDKCNHAFGPVIPTSFGAVVSYTTIHAQVDTNVPSSSCGGASDISTTPGVWYQVLGNGQPLTASTCSSSETTTFDTQLSVFTGAVVILLILSV
jgi:flagellar basal body-associated protein FliL